jgi:hypothetical protein
MAEVIEPSLDSYTAFIQSIKSEATRQDYKEGLKYFMEYLHLCPKKGEYNDIFFKAGVRLIQANIIDFVIHCKDVRKLSPSTIHGYLAGIKKFYVLFSLNF